MGAGAPSGLSPRIMASTDGELQELVQGLDPESKKKLLAALSQSNGVKVFGMPPSMNCCGPLMLAMDAGAGGFEMCNLMEGAQHKPEFLAMNPFHHIPTIKDGDFAIGESSACLRYLAMKYKPEYYPVQDATMCGMIDFACDSFATEVYPKVGPGVVYGVFGFAPAPEDQATANKEASEILDTWMKHFVKGKFVTGDRLSIADFKAVPFLFAAMQPGIEKKTGFKMSDRAKQYVEDVMAATNSSGFLKSAGGYSVAELAAQKVPDAGPAGEFAKQPVTSTFSLGKPDGKVKVYGMPVSQGTCGSILLAMDAGVGGLEMCNIMEGEQNKPEFLAMNPFHHIPTIKDGDFAIGESSACLRYIAMKYKPEYYPVKDVATCGKIDFACDSWATDVSPKVAYGVIYGVFGFAPAPEDQAKANKEASEVLDTWMKHFVKGKFVNGDSLSIADFKAVPFLFAAMQPVIESKAGFKLSDAAKEYVNNFMTAVKASEFMKSAGGFSIQEYAASKA